MHKIAKRALLATALCAATVANAGHHEGDNKAVAKGWWDASCGSLDGFMAYVDKHMADDGVFMPDRYVGLGFQVDKRYLHEISPRMNAGGERGYLRRPRGKAGLS